MKANEIMSSEHLWVCSDTSDVRHVAQLMAEHNVGSIPVVDASGRLEGIVTDRDICCRIVAQGRSFEMPVSQVMTEPVHTINPEADLAEIETMMREYKIRRLPVVDADRKLRGFISIGDLAKHVHGFLKSHEIAETLEAVSKA